MGVADFLTCLKDAPVLNQQTEKCAPKKGLPPVLEREEKKKSKLAKDEAFRNAVWTRDGGKSRATGKPLSRSGLSWDEVGEIDHVINRSTAPELVYETSNGILLSKRENRLKKTACPLAPEHHMFEVRGPDDRAKPQKFTWRDKHGKVIKETRG